MRRYYTQMVGFVIIRMGFQNDLLELFVADKLVICFFPSHRKTPDSLIRVEKASSISSARCFTVPSGFSGGYWNPFLGFQHIHLVCLHDALQQFTIFESFLREGQELVAHIEGGRVRYGNVGGALVQSLQGERVTDEGRPGFLSLMIFPA